LLAKIKVMNENHAIEIEKKQKYSQLLRSHMDELSKVFAEQLGEIQKNLQKQSEMLSEKWETNITDHIKKFEEHVKKFDLNSNK